MKRRNKNHKSNKHDDNDDTSLDCGMTRYRALGFNDKREVVRNYEIHAVNKEWVGNFLGDKGQTDLGKGKVRSWTVRELSEQES